MGRSTTPVNPLSTTSHGPGARIAPTPPPPILIACPMVKGGTALMGLPLLRLSGRWEVTTTVMVTAIRGGIAPLSPLLFCSDHNVTQATLPNLAWAIEEYEQTGRPFFVALGLHYPHCDWHVPDWSIERYPPATTLPGPKHFTTYAI